MKLNIYIFCLLMPILGIAKKSNLEYIENNGQWHNNVLFRTDLKGGFLFAEQNGVTLLFHENINHINSHAKCSVRHNHTNDIFNTNNNPSSPLVVKGHVYQMEWLNSNPTSTIIKEQQSNNLRNYFIGNQPEKWQSNVKAYHIITYQNIYNNIDVKLYSESNAQKTDYIVKKNGNPSQIKIQYSGADKISINKLGELEIYTSINKVIEQHPYAYQIINNQISTIPCQFKLKNNTVGFEFPLGYNKNYDLIIDPTLVFSTYSGSPSDNWGSSATYDNSGNMFLGGIALGILYPTTIGAFQTVFGGGTDSTQLNTDLVITKFNATGTNVIYSTYIGGNANELLQSLYHTDNNELIILATTSSLNFPVSLNAYDSSFNGGISTYALNSIYFANGADNAIIRLNATGSSIIGSTYFGGNGNDGLAGLRFNYGDETRGDIAVDAVGHILITTSTTSDNLPNTNGKAQATFGGERDGYVAKFNSNLSQNDWTTYFGGTLPDASYSIKLDKDEAIFICGGTSSNDIPSSQNGLNPTFLGGNFDGFAAKIAKDGDSIISSTYLGTDIFDQSFILDLDKEDNPVILGQTFGNYPISNGVYYNEGAKQYLHKLSNNLNTTIFSTVFGKENSLYPNISPTALLVDICGNLYAVGWGGDVNNFGDTDSMPITSDAIQDSTDGSDFYLINLNNTATQLVYASYYGEYGGVGDHVDGGTSRFDKNGVVYQAVCASCGATNGFPTTPNAHSDSNYSDNCNMAGIKFNFLITTLQVITVSATPSSGCAPQAISFSYTSTVPGKLFFWDFGDGTTSTLEYPTHTYTDSGTYIIKFIIRDEQNCNPIDSGFTSIKIATKATSTIDTSLCQGDTLVFNGLTIVAAGTFKDTLKTQFGCDSFIILNVSIKLLEEKSISTTICNGDSVILNNQTFKNAGTYEVRINSLTHCDTIITLTISLKQLDSITIDTSFCQGSSIVMGNQTITTAGIYHIRKQTPTICDSIITVNVAILPNPSIDVIADSVLVEKGSTIQLNIISNSTDLSYNWLSNNVSNTAITNPTALIQLPTWFIAKATDNITQCSGIDSVFVDVRYKTCGDTKLFIPNAFTPNGDGINDMLYINSSEKISGIFFIYDRWGKKVFETTNLNEGWNGSYEGVPQQEDSYGYYLKGRCQNGEEFILKGNISLLR